MVACTLSGDGCVHLVHLCAAVCAELYPAKYGLDADLPAVPVSPPPTFDVVSTAHAHVPTIRVCMNGARILVGFDLRIHTNADYF